MSRNKNLDQFDNLIDELKQEAERPSIPPAFKAELRGQLLNHYEQSRFSWGNLRQWAGTAVALSVLALIVFFSWSSLSQQSGAASAHMGTVDVPGRDEFIVYDQLRLELPVWADQDPGWAEMTAESWQSLDGTFFRGEVVDAQGRQRVFAQGDGQFLWHSTYDSSVERMETVALQYFDIYHALAHDIGWGGLVQSVLRLDWNCTAAACVENYLVEPPLGVNSLGGEYEPFGWGVSLIETETTANGRSLTTYRIDYSPNQDGTTGSQYRLVTLDSSSHTVVEVADYDGETLLRRLERVSHQIMTSRDLADDQFIRLPVGLGVSYILPEGRTAAETPLLASPSGEEHAILNPDTQLTLSGLMNNQLAVFEDNVVWQYVTVPNVGQGWVDESKLVWPLTSNGELVNMDTSLLPTAVPTETQLTILQTYRTELQALLPTISGEEREQLNGALQQIEAEIVRLQAQLGNNGETAANNLRVLAQFPLAFGDGFHLLDFSISPQTFVPGQPVQVNLSWEISARPSADYTAFVHLVDQSGNLLAQTDQSLGASSTFVNGTRHNTNLTLWLPDELPSDAFSIVAGLYDSATGQRLPSDSAGVYLAEIEVAEDTAVIQRAPNDVWLIAATQHARASASDPIILDVTVGYQFEADEEVELHALYGSPDWETVRDGRIPLDGLEEPVLLAEKAGTYSIRFTSTVEEMRHGGGTDQPVLVLQLGYKGIDENGNNRLNILAMPTITDFAIDLTSTEEITFPSAQAMNQHAVVSGTSGNGLTLRRTPTGEPVAILDEGSIVLLLDEPRLESEGLLWQAVETSDGQMGWVEADFISYPNGFMPLDNGTAEEMGPVQETEQPVHLESVVQEERHTAVVTLQVIVEQSMPDARLQLFLVNPDWDFDRTKLQSFQLFLPRTGEEGYFVTATPEQIRQATGTDNPIVAAILEPLDATNGTTIVQTFPEFPFDLTSREEIRYKP